MVLSCEHVMQLSEISGFVNVTQKENVADRSVPEAYTRYVVFSVACGTHHLSSGNRVRNDPIEREISSQKIGHCRSRLRSTPQNAVYESKP